MLVRVISWKWKEGLKWNLIYKKMAVRKKVHCTRTIVLSCICIALSPHNNYSYGCLSGPYLRKYIGDGNEIWFIDTWQWEEGQCTKPSSFPVYIELSLLNIVFVMVACPGHIFESTKGIMIKFGTYIDVNERKCSRQKNIILSYILIE